MDSPKNHVTVPLPREAGGGPSSADERQPPAPVHGAALVVCWCKLIGSNFLLSSMEVREGPYRRHQLALIGLAYATVTALVWLGRALPADGSARWKKLAAKLAATAVGGVLAYCTNPVVCGGFLVLCIYYD